MKTRAAGDGRKARNTVDIGATGNPASAFVASTLVSAAADPFMAGAPAICTDYIKRRPRTPSPPTRSRAQFSAEQRSIRTEITRLAPGQREAIRLLAARVERVALRAADAEAAERGCQIGAFILGRIVAQSPRKMISIPDKFDCDLPMKPSPLLAPLLEAAE